MIVQRVIIRASTLVRNKIIFSQISNQFVKRLIHTTRPTFAERLYTDKHEWVKVADRTAVVGISQYAQEALGDVVYAQLPDVDTVLTKKDECGALESVKAASEIYSPISGKVIEKNVNVEDTPALINSSCYDKGWLFKLELSNEGELKDLMSEEQYTKFLTTQEEH